MKSKAEPETAKEKVASAEARDFEKELKRSLRVVELCDEGPPGERLRKIADMLDVCVSRGRDERNIEDLEVIADVLGGLVSGIRGVLSAYARAKPTR